MKLTGRAEETRLLGPGSRVDITDLIAKLAGEFDDAPDTERPPIVEARAAGAYWALWAHFVPRHSGVGPLVHLRTRHSLVRTRHSRLPRRAMQSSIICAIAVSEMTIAPSAVGLGVEIVRSYVEV